MCFVVALSVSCLVRFCHLALTFGGQRCKMEAQGESQESAPARNEEETAEDPEPRKVKGGGSEKDWESQERSSASGASPSPGVAAQKDADVPQQDPPTQLPEDNPKESAVPMSECPEKDSESQDKPPASDPTENPTNPDQHEDPSHQEPWTQPAQDEGKNPATAPSAWGLTAVQDTVRCGLRGWKKVEVGCPLRAFMNVDRTLVHSKWRNVQKLVDSHIRKNTVVIYIGGFVAERKNRSAWVFLAEQNQVEVFQKKRYVPEMVKRPLLEEAAMTEALEWVTSQTFRQVVMVSDCMGLLNKIRCGNLQARWVQILPLSPVKTITWVFSPAKTGFDTNRAPHKIAKELCSG